MSISQSHIIGSQFFEIELNRLESSWSVQEELSTVIQDQLHPQMEQLFDRLVPSDQIIRIDRLRVDVGEISVHDLERELGPIILNILEEKIQDLMRGYSDHQEVIEVSQIPSTQRPLESLVFYLTQGYLPWWVNATIQSKLLPKWGEILQKSPLARKKFIELIGRNTTARKRFLSQIPEAERKSWMNYLIDEDSFFSQLIPSLPDILDQMTQDVSTQRKGEKLFWEILIKETFHHFSVSSGKVKQNFLHRDLLGKWIQSWVSEARILTFFNRITQFRPFFSGKLAGIPNQMKKSFQEGVLQVLAYYQKNHPKASMAFSRSDLEASFPGIEQIWEQYIPKIEDEGSERNKQANNLAAKEIQAPYHQSLDESQERGNPINPESPILSTYDDSLGEISPSVLGFSFDHPPQKLSPEQGDFFFVKNAGVVLLHPFLPRLFQYCEWTDGKKFLNLESQQQAMFMLQYLAESSQSSPEYDLLLNKILVNWPWEKVVEGKSQLEEDHKQEAEKLLKTVIEHWSALKSVSPDGLREGFLAREGKLQKTEHGWKLYLEQKTQDILLTRLPWGISMIKLPWMEEMLTVEWG